MPRIVFGAHHCAGHALCHATVPEAYDLDDHGYCLSPPTHIDESRRAMAVAGADACPEQALSVVDDE